MEYISNYSQNTNLVNQRMPIGIDRQFRDSEVDLREIAPGNGESPIGTNPMRQINQQIQQLNEAPILQIQARINALRARIATLREEEISREQRQL